MSAVWRNFGFFKEFRFMNREKEMTPMNDRRAPQWLDRLERGLGWIAIPNLAVLIITLQVLGYFFIMNEPSWVNQLALIPDAVFQGEYWRLVTFLALPLSMSPFWMFFVQWFLYFILNSLENEWGAFRTTFYVLVSFVLTIAFSLTFNYPVTQISHFESTLFLAAAALFPNFEVKLFFVFPVKMKWLAALTGAFAVLEAVRGGWLDRLYLVSIYSNFLVFFGPAAIASVKQSLRRWKYKRDLK